MKTCLTCTHWKGRQGDRNDEIIDPTDPDTYEPMDMPFKVRMCMHPQQTFCERPVEINGFGIADGSTYWAALYTAEQFGCIRHEEETP